MGLPDGACYASARGRMSPNCTRRGTCSFENPLPMRLRDHEHHGGRSFEYLERSIRGQHGVARDAAAFPFLLVAAD